jgi:hypothetical protein
MNITAFAFVALLIILAISGHPFWALFIFLMLREEIL